MPSVDETYLRFEIAVLRKIARIPVASRICHYDQKVGFSFCQSRSNRYSCHVFPLA